jgi:hypothetical protein
VQSAFSIETGYGMDGGGFGVGVLVGVRFFFLATSSIPVLGTDGHSPPTCAEVKSTWTHSLLYKSSWSSVKSAKHMNNFAFFIRIYKFHSQCFL